MIQWEFEGPDIYWHSDGPHRERWLITVTEEGQFQPSRGLTVYEPLPSLIAAKAFCERVEIVEPDNAATL